MAISKQKVKRIEREVSKLFSTQNKEIFAVSLEELEKLKNNDLTIDFIKNKTIVAVKNYGSRCLGGSDYKELILLAQQNKKVDFLHV